MMSRLTGHHVGQSYSTESRGLPAQVEHATLLQSPDGLDFGRTGPRAVIGSPTLPRA
jgi:hypothetical protein